MRTQNHTVTPTEASLRVSKKLRDALKAVAATKGRPLYDLTDELLRDYLSREGVQGRRKSS